MKLILVIDDDPIIVDFLYEMLSLEGFSAEIAFDGEQGLKKFYKENYDLVITDINMPKADGNTVAEKIRKSNRPGTPIIAISGISGELLGNNFDAIIHKPFSLDTVLKKVKKFT